MDESKSLYEQQDEVEVCDLMGPSQFAYAPVLLYLLGIGLLIFTIFGLAKDESKGLMIPLLVVAIVLVVAGTIMSVFIYKGERAWRREHGIHSSVK